MHEWALAEGILQTAIEFAKEHNGKKIKRVTIVLGELQGIEQEIVEFALDQMSKDTIAENANFEFISEEAVFKCRDCDYQWNLKDTADHLDYEAREDIHFVPDIVHTFLTCPNCGSRDFAVVKGRGVHISEIVVEE